MTFSARLVQTPARLVAPLLLAALATACGCVLGSEPGRSAGEPVKSPNSAAATDEIAPQWQKKMAELLIESGAPWTEAWGLFSEGGWSNAGQVIVLVDKDRRNGRLVTVGSNRDQIDVDRTLAAAELAEVAKAAADAAALESLAPKAFDALTFELVRLSKDGDGKPRVDGRLQYRNTGATDAPKHEAVIGAFQKLTKKS